MNDPDYILRQLEAELQVRRFFDLLRRFNGERDEASRQGRARLLVISAAAMIETMCGEEIVAAAYGSNPDPEDRSAVVNTLARRMYLASHMFGELDDITRSASLKAGAEELEAIANGDSPHLFSKISPYKVKYRLHKERLRAIEWNDYLEAISVPQYEREASIGRSYRLPWDTIRKWPDTTANVLGVQVVKEARRVAVLMGTSGLPFWSMRGGITWQDALQEDGLRFTQTAASSKQSG